MFLLFSDGSRYGGASDGLFRKPSEGQSLISYLSEQDFGSCADLEKVVVSSLSFFSPETNWNLNQSAYFLLSPHNVSLCSM